MQHASTTTLAPPPFSTTTTTSVGWCLKFHGYVPNTLTRLEAKPPTQFADAPRLGRERDMMRVSSPLHASRKMAPRRSSPSRRSPPRPKPTKPAKRASPAKPLLPSSPPLPPMAIPESLPPQMERERDGAVGAAASTSTTATLPRRLSVTIAVLMAVVAWAVVLLLAHQRDLLPSLRASSPPPLKRPPRSPRAPPMPPPMPEDDDEILCDCGWTRYPGQSCKETRGRDGFPCWQDCCANKG